MKLSEKIRSLSLMPSSIWHLMKIKKALKRIPINELLKIEPLMIKNDIPINVIVKSYFWSSRLLPNCKCLPRSVALYQKLRAFGFDVNHKLGVLKSKPNDSLCAHAWVEHKGVALNETKNLNQFIELEKLNDSIKSDTN